MKKTFLKSFNGPAIYCAVADKRTVLPFVSYYRLYLCVRKKWRVQFFECLDLNSGIFKKVAMNGDRNGYHF